MAAILEQLTSFVTLDPPIRPKKSACLKANFKF